MMQFMNTIHNTLSKLRFSIADALSNRVRLNTTLYPYPLLVESQTQALITSNPLLIENLQNVQSTLEQTTKITYLPASDIDIVESVHEQLSMQEALDDLTHQDVQILDDEPSSPSEDVLTKLNRVLYNRQRNASFRFASISLCRDYHALAARAASTLPEEAPLRVSSCDLEPSNRPSYFILLTP